MFCQIYFSNMEKYRIQKNAYPLEIHPADLFLRNASKTREEVHDFFEKEVLETVKELVEKKFPGISDGEE